MNREGPVIVAIDDYKDNLIAVKAFILDVFPTAQVFTAENGKSGIELIRAHDPDVILLDIVMPGMDGFEVCKIIKEDPLLHHIPVIFLTALKDDRKSRIRALEIGGEAFIAKPFEEAEFTAQIRAMIKIKAANERAQREKEYLAGLVEERTAELKKELEERKKTENDLKQANLVLTQNRAAMLNILADLKEEVKARKIGENLIHTVFAYLDGILFSMDKDGIFLLSDGAGLSLLGLVPGQVVGQSVFEVYKNYPDIISGMKTVLSGKQWSGIVHVQNIFFDVHVLPIEDDLHRTNGAVGIAIDITAQKRTEKALQISEEKYRQTLDATNDGLWDWDITTGMAFFSPRYYTMLGYEPGEFPATFEAWQDLIHPDEQDRIISGLMDQIKEKREFFRIEYRILAKSGKWLWILGRGKPIAYDDKGQIARLIGTNTDITLLKQAEQALRESEEKYRTLTERVHDGIYIYQGNQFVYVNDRITDITGYTKEDLYSMNIWDLADPADKARIMEITRNRALGKPAPDTYDVRIITRDGRKKYIELAVSEISYQGKYAALGAARDITDRKTMEEALRQSEERYRKLVDNIPDYILVHRNGEILFVNNAAATAFGYTKDELTGSNILQYLKPESVEVVGEMVQRRFMGDLFPSYEITILTKDGEHRIVEIHGALIQYDGEPASLNIFSDITEQKKVDDAQLFLLRSDYIKNGETFFQSLARYIAKTLDMDYVCIDRLEGDLLTARTVAVYFDGVFEDNISYTLKDTPCGELVGKQICLFSNDVRHIFPKDLVLWEMKAESYIGTTLWGFDGKPIGLIAVIGRKTLSNSHLAESILKLVSVRAAGELERIMAEKALRESEELHRAIITAIPDIFFIMNKDGIFLAYQAKELNKLLVPPEEFIGKSMHDILPKPVADMGMQAVEKALKTGELQFFEYYLDHMEGRRWYEIRIVMLSSESVLAIVRDITGRKFAEEALRESNQKLRLLTGLTRHDIFNQVSSIELLHDLALDSDDPEKIHHYLESAKEADARIEATIGFTREYEDFGIVSSGWHNVSRILESAKTEIIPGDVTFENFIPPNLEIYADPIIRKVFTTLMENAIRHGKTISSIRFSSRESEDNLIITCEDDGRGIPEDEKEKIFEHGYGEHTGIGLFIAREILSITGLSILECGEPGKGARFDILVLAGKFRWEV